MCVLRTTNRNWVQTLKSDNPEIVEAKRRKIPVIRRAEALAEIMRLKRG
ncbi:MAG TPA: Mur ligase domain-containing protein, partial [Saprospiraceae bacterium]|nr:Mur ligase domain-containing protein [Saprospiraceae bacterium]